MKGLWRRDLLSIKPYLVWLILALGALMVLFVVYLEVEPAWVIGLNAITAAQAINLLCFPMEQFSYGLTLPLARAQIIQSRYYLAGIISLLMVLFNGLGFSLLRLITPLPLTTVWLTSLIMQTLSLIYPALVLPVVTAIPGRRFWPIVMVQLPSLGLGRYIAFIYLEQRHWLSQYSNWRLFSTILPLAIAIAGGILLVSYRLASRHYAIKDLS